MDVFDKYVGRVFDKRYKIEKMIGVGGMAIVFKAEDILMNRTVAVKMLKDDISNDTPSIKRFVNESKAVAMLSHPNIVNIYDVSVKDNLKYIVMEYIEGITLKSYIQKKGVLSWRETLNITEQILKALEHAHSKGVIHRDIKPHNIMLLKNGIIKVADFGIAKIPNTESNTLTDTAIGTVQYISPEQASGQEIDEKSDLYSVGVLMYELVTGKLPFEGDTPISIALKHVNDEPKKPREINDQIPPGMEQIILRAMSKDPTLRYQTAKQMLKHIAALKENPNIKFRPPVPAEPSKKAVGTQKKKTGAEPEIKQKVVTRGNSFMPIVLGITSAFLIVIGICAAYFFTKMFSSSDIEGEKTIIVDNYIGQSYSESMRQHLTDIGYNVIIKRMASSDAAENKIISQAPESGAQRKVILGRQHADLTLYVSTGSETIKLPDYTMMPYRQVKIDLEALGYKVNIERNYNDAVISGYIYNTTPLPGSDVSVGQTITLHVSDGQQIEMTKVPEMRGLHQTEAMRQLVSSGLSLGKVTYTESDLPKGAVVSQSIEPMTEVPKNSTSVDFVLSLGPYEDPSQPSDNTGDETTETPPETAPQEE